MSKIAEVRKITRAKITTFTVITKLDNLLMVTNNELGKFYGLKCLF